MYTVELLYSCIVYILSAGLWKVGQCFQDLLDNRPRDAAHYNPQCFNRDGAIVLVHGLVDTARAEQLETDAIQRAKLHLRTGVNDKSKDAVSHDLYSHERPGAVYAVPVRSDVATTQDEFKQVHVSYYMERTHGGTTKEERKAAKRFNLLDELIDAIPMQQLQRAFAMPNKSALNKLQTKYDFNESNNEIYKELQTLFDERY